MRSITSLTKRSPFEPAAYGAEMGMTRRVDTSLSKEPFREIRAWMLGASVGTTFLRPRSRAYDKQTPSDRSRDARCDIVKRDGLGDVLFLELPDPQVPKVQGRVSIPLRAKEYPAGAQDARDFAHNAWNSVRLKMAPRH